jgi:hypothetical protein
MALQITHETLHSQHESQRREGGQVTHHDVDHSRRPSLPLVLPTHEELRLAVRVRLLRRRNWRGDLARDDVVAPLLVGDDSRPLALLDRTSREIRLG